MTVEAVLIAFSLWAGVFQFNALAVKIRADHDYACRIVIGAERRASDATTADERTFWAEVAEDWRRQAVWSCATASAG